MPGDAKEEDENAEADRAVRALTGVEPLNAEECFASPELQRQFREAKEREKQRSASEPVRK